jgi:DNA-binding transcriptional ArsR family regulator
LLNALSDGERTVTGLNAAVGTSQENISKHLRVLREAGLVTRQKTGQWIFYSIADDQIQELLHRAILGGNREKRGPHPFIRKSCLLDSMLQIATRGKRLM